MNLTKLIEEINASKMSEVEKKKAIKAIKKGLHSIMYREKLDKASGFATVATRNLTNSSPATRTSA